MTKIQASYRNFSLEESIVICPEIRQLDASSVSFLLDSVTVGLPRALRVPKSVLFPDHFPLVLWAKKMNEVLLPCLFPRALVWEYSGVFS